MKLTKLLLLIFILPITFIVIYIVVRFIGVQGFLFAFNLNFILMTGVGGFIQILKGKNTSNYFNHKPLEQKGKIYKFIGINFFRKLLVWIGWEKLNKKSNPIEKNIKSLKHLHYQTKQSELAHLIILIIVLFFNFLVAFKFGILKSLWLLVLNILLNFYPILLQRYNRPRIERIINLSKQR
ncbi:hypothetical protein [Flavobacterium sp.]|uniref:glycosyl-4,4'-diaponeurosporenoate acyltransferase CrtO family protein n=1 Tax=Flavobacterium sp. TaxID=239 RepID=UPI00286BC7CC|nr:hypothetical protein [Flavobacterium sp.]